MDSHKTFSIREWAEEDRPREKLLTKGRSALSEAELIAILIGSGTRTMSAVELSKQILHSVDNNLNRLAKLTVKDLMKFNGIGEAKAISIISALELGRRRKSDDVLAKPRIISSMQAYQEIRDELVDLPHEEFWILLLKRNNELIRKVRVSSGGVDGTVVDGRIIFKHALEDLATAIVLVHNHPSGNLRPSQTDIRLTDQLVKSGRIMDITVQDHIIVTEKDFYSFSDEGRM